MFFLVSFRVARDLAAIFKPDRALVFVRQEERLFPLLALY